jgi:hypothetical protein
MQQRGKSHPKNWGGGDRHVCSAPICERLSDDRVANVLVHEVHRTVRLRARLLKRVFVINLQHCPSCGGPLMIIAVIPEAPLIEKILTQLRKTGLWDLSK